MKDIYLDYQSTTPCDRMVFDAMVPYFFEEYGNPHSTTHKFGRNALDAVEKARQQVAHIIGANQNEIIFTSGATESNNLAIKGAAHFYKSLGNRIITCKTEHKCVLESCHSLEREGFDVIYLDVDKEGLINLEDLKKHINDNTILVSIMTVNNEIGVIQDIKSIAEMCKSHNNKIIFHTDAAQAIGKINMKDISLNNVDLMSISGHKIYGPKGIGALYVKSVPRIRLTPIFDGGGQERGLRSGTLPTPLCVGLGAACEISEHELIEESKRILRLRDFLLNELLSNLKKVYVNGSMEKRIPGNLNLSFAGIEGESIMVGMKNIALSSGSACTSAVLEPSYVLNALMVNEDLAHSSIRIGIGRFTTREDMEHLANSMIKVVNRLREMSPIWEE